MRVPQSGRVLLPWAALMGNEFRRRIVTADDEDVHTRWRRLLCIAHNHPSFVRSRKRATNKRERREGRAIETE